MHALKFRSIVLIFLFLVVSAANGQSSNALVFIRPEAVSRAIKPESYNHGLWIQWPLPSTTLGTNRLLSPITGVDWWLADDPLVASMEFAKPDQQVIQRLGVLQARRDHIGYTKTIDLKNASGSIGRDVVLVALNADGSTKELDFNAPIPAGTLVIYEAATWEDAAEVSRKVSGNTLLIAYPPTVGATLSPAWFLGKDDLPITNATGVPGLVPARQVISLVQHPDNYAWRPPTDVTPEQWMSTIVRTRPTQFISLFAFALLVFVVALRSLATESGGRLARIGLGMLPIAFLSVYLAGNFAKATGLMPWNILPFFAYFALLLGLMPAYLAMRALWPKSHPLLPIALGVSTILLWATPLYSIYSNVFSQVPLPISPIPLGALAAALTASAAMALSSDLWPRLIAAGLFCAVMILSVLANPWWTVSPIHFLLPIICLLCAAGAMRAYVLPLFIVWPLIFHSWNGHFAWDLNWLFTHYDDRFAINGAAIVQFLLSPLWLCTLAIAVIVMLAGGNFLRHQLRRSYASSNNARSLFWCALCIACMGLREPYLLSSALIVLIGAFTVLLFDAAGSL